MRNSMLDGTYRMARRIVIAVVGSTVLLLGIIMLATPGPGLVAIAAGLGILAIEFTWARLWLKRVRRRISEANEQLRGDAAENHRSD